jgi:DNA polymerase-3 subunit alpha
MFKNLHDFCQRCTPNKGTIEAAIKSGALDDMGPHRSSLMATYPKAVGIGKQAAKKELGNPQINMFGSLMDDESIIKFEDTHPWDDNYQLAGERFTLGMYLTGHPITAYETELSSIISGKLVDLIGTDLEDGNGDLDASDDTKQLKWEDKNVTVAGLIMNMEIKISPKNSQQTGYLTIDDKSKQVDVMVFSKTLHDCQHLLQPDTTVIIEGKLKMDKKTKRIRLFASNIKTIDMARERNASGILLDLSATNFNADVKDKLKDLMGKQPEGYAEIVANFTGTDLETKRIKLGTYQIKITDTLIHELKNIVGKNNVSVEYKDKKQPVGVAGIAFRERQKIERIEDGQRTREMRHKVIAQEFENAKIAMGM